jgi:hypothetical protein
MLSTVFTNLQTLIPGRFVVSSFFPMLAFSVANGGMLFWLNAPFRALASKTMNESTAGQSTFLIGVVVIGLTMLAYISSALLPPTQLIMEGRWPDWLIGIFAPAQAKRLEHIENEALANDRRRGELEAVVGGKTKAADWVDRLYAARRAGSGAHANLNNFTLKHPAAEVVGRLKRRRGRNEPIHAEAIEGAVNALVGVLGANDADVAGPDGDYALEVTLASLQRLVSYAIARAQSEELRLLNKVRFGYGSHRVAPTLMGNIANTVQSYAEERYSLNFEVFWVRMQRAIHHDKEFAPILEQAKMQLDFLISCAGLTAVWSAIWFAIVAGVGLGLRAFLLASVAGPVIAYTWYRIAVAQYQTYADVLRTSIDLFRFDLLKDLHFALPDDIPGERELWDTLHRVHSLYEPQGLRYQHPKTS